MSKKTLVILLLALLLVSVLFVVSLILGGRGPDSGLKFNPRSPAMARISGLLSRPVLARDLMLRSGSAAECHLENNRIIIRAGQTCVYSVAADRFLTRRLLLAHPSSDDHSGRLNIVLEQTLPGQEKSIREERILEPGKTADPLDIYAHKDYTASLTIVARGLPFFDPDEYVIEIVTK